MWAWHMHQMILRMKVIFGNERQHWKGRKKERKETKTYIYMCACVCVCVCARTRARVCVRVCICIYVRTKGKKKAIGKKDIRLQISTSAIPTNIITTFFASVGGWWRSSGYGCRRRETSGQDFNSFHWLLLLNLFSWDV